MKNRIDVYLQEKESYINQFHKERISPELSDYILEECKNLSLKETFEIHIHSKEFNKEEQLHFVDMLRQNYGVDIQELNLIAEKSKLMSLSCILMGIFILFFYILIDIVPVLSEIVLIIAWVLIWEGVYNLLFDGMKNRIQIKRLKKLTRCKIIFEEKA